VPLHRVDVSQHSANNSPSRDSAWVVRSFKHWVLFGGGTLSRTLFRDPAICVPLTSIPAGRVENENMLLVVDEAAAGRPAD
jgi:hypothetical protein